tara:strand:+ start:972 stop:1220 length:249 start_codon:yes stop_codon:yes gene_type:complete
MNFMKLVEDKPVPYCPKYVFTDVPNDDTGKAFIFFVKKYLNTKRYKMRIRGQHLKDGLNWREHRYGQSIKNSKSLRVYIEEK